MERAEKIRIPLDLTHEAMNALMNLDEAFVGTENYMGLAIFWHPDYNGLFGLGPFALIIKAHNALQDAGLPLNGASPEHEAVIIKVFSRRLAARRAERAKNRALLNKVEQAKQEEAELKKPVRFGL